MFNDFLTTTLQVVIALNVAGLIGYFCLGSRRRPTPTPAFGRSPNQDFGHHSPQVLDASGTPSLWNKLIAPCRRAIGRERQMATVSATGRTLGAESLDASLGRLRRVLDGYGSSLS